MLFLLLWSREAKAGGYEFFGMGIRPLNMGGAFIAVADEPSATYWNPAGLAQLKGSSLSADMTYDTINWRDRNSMRNLDPGELSTQRGDIFFRVNPSEPGRFNDVRIFAFAASASYSGNLELDPSTTLGYSVYMPNGNFVKWDDEVEDPSTQAEVKGTYFSQFFLSVTNLSIARQVTPELSLGAGLDFVLGRFKTDAGKDYRGGISFMNTNYEFDLETDAQGIGFEGIFGILYRITPRMKVGAVYRTGAQINVRGHAMTRLRFKQNRIEDFHETTDFDQDFPLPPTWGVGIAYDVSKKLTVAFDWQGTDWKVMKTDINFDTEGDALKNVHQSLDWHRSNRYRLGAEYRLKANLAVQAGYTYDQNAVPDKSAAITTISAIPLHIITTGLTYSFKDDWEVKLHIDHHFGKNKVDGEDIKDKDIMFGLGIAHHF